MLDLILLVLLLAGVLIGFKRGLVLQFFHMVGFVVALIVAYTYFRPLAENFVLWVPYPTVDDSSRIAIAVEQLNLDETFYQLLAFAIIFFTVKFLLMLIASMFDFVKYIPVLGFLSRILGAVLGFIEAYVLLFFAVYVFALLPIDGIQNQIENSGIARALLEHTPYFSEKVKEWWYIYM
ncbi:CvpA family protein [Planococcus sp. ISL-109]|uniref:CvpA family protein n=1 Tax=Planococcus sp. ISL-109 TaxID=2819166 RepID=UPI001BEA3AB0|nr:CvpA family protein [Planococcus sp. ISL-109]MBT2582472.1 CvpA family protein [Planococcus sp. ISL-109]